MISVTANFLPSDSLPSALMALSNTTAGTKPVSRLPLSARVVETGVEAVVKAKTGAKTGAKIGAKTGAKTGAAGRGAGAKTGRRARAAGNAVEAVPEAVEEAAVNSSFTLEKISRKSRSEETEANADEEFRVRSWLKDVIKCGFGLDGREEPEQEKESVTELGLAGF